MDVATILVVVVGTTCGVLVLNGEPPLFICGGEDVAELDANIAFTKARVSGPKYPV